MYTTKYKKGDKIKTFSGSILEYVGIDRSLNRKNFIYLPIKTTLIFGTCGPEWEKEGNLQKGSIPFSEKLRGEKI